VSNSSPTSNPQPLPILAIIGPTASGKTQLALELAHGNPEIEIVNADAQLLYKGFDIGTAKPSKEELAAVPHHLISILEPPELFSAADYTKIARACIRDILKRGKTPIVVGGTGFYIDALFFGLSPTEVPKEILAEVRLRVAREIESMGFEVMHERLKEIDPVLYHQIAREQNPIRLTRAWEMYYATGIPLGETRKHAKDTFEYKPELRMLNIPRNVLWKRIEERTQLLLDAGWLEEVRVLLQMGVTIAMPAMKAIGYKELAEVINEKLPLEKAVEKIIIRTRQYAKRQVTWLRRYEDFVNK
jgi:tRNA dimethylallyltransferase